MTRLLRPYIPLSVRIKVAYRQAQLITPDLLYVRADTQRGQLTTLLRYLFKGERVHLDHDPALENREKIYGVVKGVIEVIRYIPDANDPEYLIYRTKQDHYIKTHVRGDGAQYSDTALAKRERRRQKPKRKHNWPKGRKIQNRKGAWYGRDKRGARKGSTRKV